MKLKKIDTESKKYRIAREAVKFTGYTGGVYALDCVVVPFVKAVLAKNRTLRLLGYFGTINLSILAGKLSAEVADIEFDNIVELWNMFCEKDEKTEEKDDVVERMKQYRKDDVQTIVDMLEEDDVLRFDSYEAADDFAKKLIHIYETKHCISVQDIYNIREMICGNPVLATIYGWTNDRLAIERAWSFEHDDADIAFFVTVCNAPEILPNGVTYVKLEEE